MEKEKLMAALRATMLSLEETTALYTDEEFNRQPSGTAWSAAQVTEHLLLLEKIAGTAIRGAGVPTNRDPDSKLSIIQWAMEDETRRQAPEVVLPSNEQKNVQTLTGEVKTEREKLLAAVESADLSEACKAFKHPALGTLTKLEWAWFTVCHMKRHTIQLARLKEKLQEASA